MSSSAAPSATELTSAIAFRIRSAARPATNSLLGRRFARSDNDATLRLLTDAATRHVRVALECEVDCSAFERLHGIESDRVAGHLDLASCAHCDLAHGVLPPLPV